MSSETPQTYTASERQFISYYGNSIKSAAQALATQSTFSAATLSTLIAGCIAEELHDRNESYFDIAQQAFSDNRVSGLSNQRLLDSYNDVKLGKLDVFSKMNHALAKQLYPSLLDVGPANIQIQTAMRLLENYISANPSTDPLTIKAYASNLRQLALDLMDKQSAATAKFAGLMTIEGEKWLIENTSNWAALNTDQKSGLIIYYFNVGKDYMDSKVAANGGVDIDVNYSGTDIALEFVQNKTALATALATTSIAPGSSYGGPVAFVNVTTEGNDVIYAVAANSGPVNSLRGGSDIFSVGDDLANSAFSVDGGAGNDMIFTGNATDVVDGGDGNDLLDAAGGADTLRGGSGDDIILIIDAGDHVDAFLSFNDEIIDGGIGNDVIRFWGLRNGDTLVLNDKTIGIERVEISDWAGGKKYELNRNVDATQVATALTIYGNDGKNKIVGTQASDYIYGEGGNDLLIGGAGSDSLFGGDGKDVLDGYGSLTAAVEVDFLYGGAGADSYYMDSADKISDTGLDNALDICYWTWPSSKSQISDADGIYTTSLSWSSVPSSPLARSTGRSAVPDSIADLVRLGLAKNLVMSENGHYDVGGKTADGGVAGGIEFLNFNFGNGDIHLDAG
jgi:RTX calcium-binding nonapeptide repeat (4 copies)